MIKLSELDAVFVALLPDNGNGDYIEVDDIAAAQGVCFDCPKCGRHSILCWSRSRGVSDHILPGPGRWKLVGTGLHDLTLNADLPNGARSVDLSRAGVGCGWHGFVTDGMVSSL